MNNDITVMFIEEHSDHGVSKEPKNLTQIEFMGSFDATWYEWS